MKPKPHERFFAALRMTVPGCHSERSEESLVTMANPQILPIPIAFSQLFRYANIQQMLGGAYLWKEQRPTMQAVEKKSDNIVTFPAKSGTKLEYHPTIHDMPSEERPRERLRNYGARVLSNAELLAIILRTGTTQDNVIELAGKLLNKYGGFGGLMRAEFMELCAEYGLGEAKTAQLKAALEIGRRLGIAQHEEKYQIKSPLDAANLVMMEMTFLDHEQMRILVLDTKNQVVENISRYQGTVNSSVLRAAEIYRPAVIRNCPGVIICHNHPSGDPTPSPEDIAVTEQLVQAGRHLDIELVDHLVIGNQRYVSLKERMKW